MNDYIFQAIHTSVRTVSEKNNTMVQVIKTEKLDEPDTNSYAKLSDVDFHNGVIDVDVYSELLPDAPDYSRGFIGIAYRIANDDSSFESFYLRPTNGRCDDMVRRNHASQYFSYPKYTFSYFREHNISDYESPVDIGLGEWIHIKAVIKDERADFFVNNNPVLTVDHMKRGSNQRGAVGFFVDIGTKGFFKNLTISYDED